MIGADGECFEPPRGLYDRLEYKWEWLEPTENVSSLPEDFMIV